jgi:L-threonylcarbamoyladenylate synthase
MQTILFVCTGNTCRSPMAEAIARSLIDKGLLGDGSGFFVASAGVATGGGSAATPEALAALANLGIDHTGTSTPLTGEMVRNADVVFGMTDGHVLTAREAAGKDVSDRVVRLDPDGDIDDPIGLDLSAYDALAQAFLEILPRRLKEFMDI